MSILQIILFIFLFFFFRFCLNIYFKIRAFKKMVAMGPGKVYVRGRAHSHGQYYKPYPPSSHSDSYEPPSSSAQGDVEVSYRVLEDK